MLDKSFILPPLEVAQRETEKRLDLIKKVAPEFKGAISGIVVSGSVAYGQDYSVTENSDIDTQILVTRDSVEKLLQVNLFDKEKLQRSIAAYMEGVVNQFSVSQLIDKISLECHFWDKDAYISAVTLESAFTTRLRNSLTPPSADYAYSFDGEEDEKLFSGTMSGEWMTGQFPSFRRKNDKLFLCRPVTNILGNPFIVYGGDLFKEVFNLTWNRVITELGKCIQSPIDLNVYNIFNTLPGKHKISPAVKVIIFEKTKQELEKSGIIYKS